jgi:hypothetical protein
MQIGVAFAQKVSGQIVLSRWLQSKHVLMDCIDSDCFYILIRDSIPKRTEPSRQSRLVSKHMFFIF